MTPFDKKREEVLEKLRRLPLRSGSEIGRALGNIYRTTEGFTKALPPYEHRVFGNTVGLLLGGEINQRIFDHVVSPTMDLLRELERSEK